MNLESFGNAAAKAGGNPGDITSGSSKNRQAKTKPITNELQAANAVSAVGAAPAAKAMRSEAKPDDRCKSGACEIVWKPTMRMANASSNA